MGGKNGFDSLLDSQRDFSLAPGGKRDGQTRGGVRGRDVRHASDGVTLRRSRRLRALPCDVDAGGPGQFEKLGRARRDGLGHPRCVLLSGRGRHRLARLPIYRRRRDLAAAETGEDVTPSRGRPSHSCARFGDPASLPVPLR